MIHSMSGWAARVGSGRAVPTYRYSVLATCAAIIATGCGSERVAIGSFENSTLALGSDAGKADSGGFLTDDAEIEFYMLPAGFTPATKGGYKLGDPLTSSMLPASAAAMVTSNRCTGTILGVVRDFKRGDWADGHPDFETFAGNGETGIVEATLGPDSKPVYVDTPHKFTTTKANFDQWYRNVPGVNDPYLLYLVVEPNDGGVFTFDSQSFFPLDDMGFGNQDLEHNFSFTTEVHTTFLYNGGEIFRFTGDDDLWVFINGHLSIDLGGLHPQLSSTVELDSVAGSVGLQKGGTYPLDLFHAERHSHASDFRIDTTIRFVNCAIIVDVK
jgi:fibro-slime domain-containing protein